MKECPKSIELTGVEKELMFNDDDDDEPREPLNFE